VVRHLFVCTNGRSSGKPACGPRGGEAIVAGVQRELIARRALGVLITDSGCLGPCFDGPNAVVYPDGVWYSGLTADDAAALVDHLVDGTRLAAKLSHRPGAEPDSSPDGDSADSERSGDGGDTADHGNDRRR